MAQNPDVRVRLSAEGVEDVVNALKRVQGEAQKAGKGAAQGIGVLNSALGDLKALLPALSLAAAVTSIAYLVKQSLQAADAMGKLSQKTGATTETLSVLSLAATTADVSQEGLAKGLQKLSRSLDELQGGGKEATDAFKRIGLSAKDLEGLDTGSAFVKIAERFGDIKDSAAKAALAQQIFGKSGADLIPLMNDLAHGGFEEVRKKAEEMGLVIDSDLAEAAQRANDSLTDLGNRAKGIATQFLSGFAPDLAQAMDVVGEAVSGQGVNGFKTLGEVAGKVAKGIVAVFLMVGKYLGATFAEVYEYIIGLSNAAKALLSVDLAGAAKAYRESRTRREAISKAYEEDLSKTMADLFYESGSAGTTKTQKRGSYDAEAASDKEALKAQQDIARARLEYRKAALENEERIIEAALKANEDSNKAAYEQGLISLEEYYSRRKEILLSGIDQEIATLEAKRKLLETSPAGKTEADEIKRKQELEALDAQISVKQIERMRTETNLVIEQQKAVKQLAEEQKRKGVLTEEFATVEQQAETALWQLSQDRQRIQDEISQGKIFEMEGEDRIVALEVQRIPQLKKIADQMMLIAEASGDEKKIRAAEEFSAAIRELAISTDLAGQRMAEFKKTVQNAMVNGLAQFFIDVTSGAKDVKDAFRDMVLSVIEAIQQMLAQMLAMMAIKAMFGAFGFSTVGMSGGGRVKAATGGLILGPGTGTSDSIPAWLSDGEFVVRAAVVKQPGIFSHLQALNAGMLTPGVRRSSGPRRFADGGLVTAGQGGSMDSSLTVGLEPGLVLKEIQSSEGQRILVRVLGQNKRAAKQALGG